MVHFCDWLFNRWDRTSDQMMQAARSGKQNIFEASEASRTSKERELKLAGIGPSGQEGLIGDCRDFMRDRHIEEWTLDRPYLCQPRQLTRIPGANYGTFKKGVEHRDPAICSNVIVGLIKVTCSTGYSKTQGTVAATFLAVSCVVFVTETKWHERRLSRSTQRRATE